MNMIEIFCSCTQEDEKYLIELGKHLKVLENQHMVRWWHVSHIPAGVAWEAERDRHLNSAQIILLMVSPDFINSPSCYQHEMKQAMIRFEQGEAQVIPILLRDSPWEQTPFHILQPLPSNGQAISRWRNRDQAFAEVFEGILAVLKKIGIRERQILPVSSDTPLLTRSEQTWNQSLDKAMFEHFKEFEYLPKLAQFEARAQRHKHTWKRLQWATVGIAVATWLLVMIDLLILNPPPPVELLLKFLTVLSATLMIACTLLMANSYSHDRWLNYLRRVDDLKNEEKMYTYKIDVYANDIERERLFMSRVNSIIEKGEAGTKSSNSTDEYRPPRTQ